jgi:hypothetical protein
MKASSKFRFVKIMFLEVRWDCNWETIFTGVTLKKKVFKNPFFRTSSQILIVYWEFKLIKKDQARFSSWMQK